MTKVIARVHPVHLMNVDWALRRVATNPQTKPIDLGCEIYVFVDDGNTCFICFTE